MPAPRPGIVQYRFIEPSDGWTGTHETVRAEVADAYDIHAWAPASVQPTSAFAYKQATNVSHNHRVSFDFSITSLPNLAGTSKAVGFLGLSYEDNLAEDPDWWTTDFQLYLLKDGRLSFVKSGAWGVSTGTITPGTTYHLEAHQFDNQAGTRTYRRIYIDGVLWITYDFAYYEPLKDYVQLEIGMGLTVTLIDYMGAVDVVLHVEKIRWTMEKLGGASWTMMAP